MAKNPTHYQNSAELVNSIPIETLKQYPEKFKNGFDLFILANSMKPIKECKTNEDNENKLGRIWNQVSFM